MSFANNIELTCRDNDVWNFPPNLACTSTHTQISSVAQIDLKLTDLQIPSN